MEPGTRPEPESTRSGDPDARVAFVLDGDPVEVAESAGSLLDALRDHLGRRSAKDGCSPQGQCGCCTVLVDGAPRVACVTPVRRVAGRAVTTVDGLDPADRDRWAGALCATGGSQCGFCTPGIVVRLAGLEARSGADAGAAAVDRALAAHLCRCTGWRTIVEAWDVAHGAPAPGPADRDLAAAARRASIEGGCAQQVGPEVALGRGGFADDDAPEGALVAVPDGRGDWAVGETLAEARAAAGKVQGRRTTVAPRPPLAVPAGSWDVTLRTGWIEPAYLETDASWCLPGGEPASPLGNGGAFGAKQQSPAPGAARLLADRYGRAVRVLLSREDVVRLGPKRPPLSAGVLADGTGEVVVARTAGIARAIASIAPGLRVREVDVPGPPTSSMLRGAGWAEAAVLLAAARGGLGPVRSPSGAEAQAEIGPGGAITVRVACGDPLDEVVLRSYCIGAAHMALSWVCSEGLAVSEDGEVLDLTVRSFGVLRAADMPEVTVEIDRSPGPPVNGSDAVLAAVAAAAWIDQGCPQDWPTLRGAHP